MDIKIFYIYRNFISNYVFNNLFLSYYMNKKNCPKEDILNVSFILVFNNNSYGFYY